MSSSKPSIFIGVPTLGDVRVELAINWLRWVTNPRYQVTIYPTLNVQPTPVARNQIVKAFLDSNCEYLLMIDSNVIPPQNILDLALLDKDIVGGVCFICKDNKLIPVVLKEVPNGFSVYDDLPSNTLMEVDAIGTGCIMIKRKVLEEWSQPYFEFRFDVDGMLSIGEDFYFCQKAKSLSYNILVHTGYLCAHYSSVDLTGIAQKHLNDLMSTARS